MTRVKIEYPIGLHERGLSYQVREIFARNSLDPKTVYDGAEDEERWTTEYEFPDEIMLPDKSGLKEMVERGLGLPSISILNLEVLAQ